MGLRFNPAPGWPPAPEGFAPPPGWQPDPAWPPMPAGWPLWVSDDAAPDDTAAAAPPPAGTEPAQSVPPWAPPGQPPPTTAEPVNPSPWQAYPGQGPPTDTPPWQAYPGQTPPTDTPAWQAYPGQTPPGQTYPGYPGPGYPGFGYSGPGYPGQPPAKNGYAIASFIAGILGFVGLSLIFSIVFGIMALVQIRRRPQGGKGFAIAGLVLSGVWIVILGGLIALGIASHPSPATGQTSGGGNTNVFSLRVGDCFQNPTGADASLGVSYVSVVPCTTGHNAQMFAEFRVTGTGYPGRSSLLRQADRGCRARISGNLVKSKVTATMELHFLYPFSGSWADGHRTISCLIVDAKRDLTSSLMVH